MRRPEGNAVEPLRHDPDPAHAAHLEEVRRVLALPLEVTGFRWHPFGVYTAPLAKRSDAAGTWSRRLHVWHPAARPVGPASPYGIHTHSGMARSHVVVGTIHHHLYDFVADADGVWQRARLGTPEGPASLSAHVWGPTTQGMTHTFPKDQPHGVTKPDGWAVSLFEQLDGPTEQPFTTWQRTDVPAEELERTGPVPAKTVLQEARSVVDQALARCAAP